MSDQESAYANSQRPAIALITNHGYGGATIPFGGAADTGGQNQYVNSLALALDALSYRVTIFARGGFPHFKSDRIRRQPEFLSDHVRYVFVNGGGNEFIRKEDIAVALDEEVQWLDAFIRAEAAQRRCAAWQVYEFVNTHYWDAAIMGIRLVERWRNDVAATAIGELLDGIIPSAALESFQNERHWNAVGDAPAFHLGQLLMNDAASPATPLVDRVAQAAERLAVARSVDRTTIVERLVQSVQSVPAGAHHQGAPVLKTIMAADAAGRATLECFPEAAGKLHRQAGDVDRHVWTPHSLGSLKDRNFRDQAQDVRRRLKFCERRSHERSVCNRTRMFVATSQEIATQFRTHFGVQADRVFYFPPCVNPEVFRPYQPDELAKTWQYISELSGISLEKLRASRFIFETSRMDRTKRKDLLLDAFAQVARQRDDVYLLIGGGPENAIFESLAARRDADPHLAGRAFLAGFIPEEHIGPLFSLADAYVSTSEMEGFGMSALQAAAAGTALVASDLTPFAVQYVPECALIATAGDADAFAAAMRQLLDDEAERRRRGDRLLDRVKTLHWDVQTLGFLEFLRQDRVSRAEADPEAGSACRLPAIPAPSVDEEL